MDLKTNTLFTGKVCIFLPQVSSTQQYLQQLTAKSKPIEGTAILSYNQTAGRGQRDNIWQSMPDKDIAVSILFYPVFLVPTSQFYFNIAIALAVRATVAAYTQAPVWIKWPNDIIINHRKVAGILVNASTRAGRTESMIAGVGINVNRTQFTGLPFATSLVLQGNDPIELNELCASLFQHIEQWYLMLKSGRTGQILDQFNNHLYGAGQEVELMTEGRPAEPIRICHVNSDGKMIISNGQGELLTLALHEANLKYPHYS